MPLRFLNGHGERFPVMSVPRVEHKRSPLSFAGKRRQDVADQSAEKTGKATEKRVGGQESGRLEAERERIVYRGSMTPIWNFLRGAGHIRARVAQGAASCGRSLSFDAYDRLMGVPL